MLRADTLSPGTLHFMGDPHRTERFGAPQPWSRSAEPQGSNSAPRADPAYAEPAPYASPYGAPPSQWGPNPTQQLPPYWQYDQPPPDGTPTTRLTVPPPEGPRSPRWLWIAAAAAVLLVVGLVIALIIANGSMKTQTAVEPLPPMPGPSSALPAPTTRTHTPRAAPPPPATSAPGETTEPTEPGATQPVVYNVNGDGRAISITYLDTGGLIQTEFNVSLPWIKEVSLAKSATHPANVTIVNIGHNVTCSVTVAGVQVRQRTGVGITICDAPLS
jgi:Mycobacterium membrane protein